MHALCPYMPDMSSLNQQNYAVILAATPSPMPTLTPTPTSGPAITDWLTGVGTIALALATVLTLIVTVYITTTDRRRADKRLVQEAKLRRKERRDDAAMGLIGRTAAVIPYVLMIPAALHRDCGPETDMVRQAIRALEYGAHTDVLAIDDERAADQYRNLASLSSWVASNDISQQVPADTEQSDIADGYVNYADRVPVDLLSYAFFVRMSLENLVQTGQSLDPGEPACPDLTPDRYGPRRIWQPANPPPGWRKIIPKDALESIFPFLLMQSFRPPNDPVPDERLTATSVTESAIAHHYILCPLA